MEKSFLCDRVNFKFNRLRFKIKGEMKIYFKCNNGEILLLIDFY